MPLLVPATTGNSNSSDAQTHGTQHCNSGNSSHGGLTRGHDGTSSSRAVAPSASSPVASVSNAPAASGWTPLSIPSGASRRRACGGSSPGWLRALLRVEGIQSSARALVAQPLPPALAGLSPGSADLPPIVYAHQRELAIVSPGVVEYVGSGDATTCVIVALRCARTRRTAVAHLDGADPGQLQRDERAAAKRQRSDGQRCTSIRDTLDAFTDEDLADGLDVHVVGGFQTHHTARDEEEHKEDESHDGAGTDEECEDESGSDDLDQSDGLVQVRDLLLLLHSYARARPCAMRLQTLCVGPLNTAWGPDDLPPPAVAAMAHHALPHAAAAKAGATHSSAAVMPDDDVPALTAAAAAAAVASLSFPRPFLTSLFLHVDTGVPVARLPYARSQRGPAMPLRILRGGIGPPDELSHVYEERDDRFCVRAFKHDPMHPGSLRALLSLPDAQFLLRSSTSPLVEPPFFLPDMRECYELLAQRPRWQMSFPRGEREEHWFERCGKTNHWQGVKQ